MLVFGNKMKKLSKKFLFSISILFSLVLIFVHNSKKALGTEIFEEEGPISICTEPQEINLPWVEEKIPLMENKLEMPIGQTVDFTENMGEEIIAAIDVLCAAADELADNTEFLISLVNKCSQEPYGCTPHCDLEGEGYKNGECFDSCPSSKPYECDEYTYCRAHCPWEVGCCSAQDKKCCCEKKYSCKAKLCTGSACPQEQIGNRVDQIENNAIIIRESFERIDDFFTPRFEPMYLYADQFWEYEPKKLSYYIEIPGWLEEDPMVNDDQFSKDVCDEFCYVYPSKYCELCSTPVEIEIEEKLEKSRERLWECVVRISEEEAEERGEIEGKFLEDCKVAMPIAIEECYGNIYCEACEKVPEACQEERLGDPPKEGLLKPPLGSPSSSPCAENFFCCFIKEKL